MTDRKTDRRTDGRSDKAGCRVAYTRLKTSNPRFQYRRGFVDRGMTPLQDTRSDTNKNTYNYKCNLKMRVITLSHSNITDGWADGRTIRPKKSRVYDSKQSSENVCLRTSPIFLRRILRRIAKKKRNNPCSVFDGDSFWAPYPCSSTS